MSKDLASRSAADLRIDWAAFMAELFPICRSITGDGLRQTLDIIGDKLPLERHEVATGTAVHDWTVPKEWNVRDAFVADSSGRRVIDFRESNLHLVNYSVPVRRRMQLNELREHLHTLPDQPDLIPYRTSYYNESWGFCLRQRDLDQFEEGEYEVVIDSSLEDGHLSYGELFLPGEREGEVLITTHVCHPSMCNDNLSGVSVLTALGQALTDMDRRWSYRLLFIPGTIGAITWLARNQAAAQRVRFGMVLAGLGDRGPLSWKQSRSGNSAIDRAVGRVLAAREHRILGFSPYGYDERQFCSPAFNLPVGRLSRSEYATYPEYHSSGDDLDFVSTASLDASFQALLEVIQTLETEDYYVNTQGHCEPQLGRRGLYDLPLEAGELQRVRLAMLWVLDLSDGSWSLRDIADRADLPLDSIQTAADALRAAGILEPVG